MRGGCARRLCATRRAFQDGGLRPAAISAGPGRLLSHPGRFPSRDASGGKRRQALSGDARRRRRLAQVFVYPPSLESKDRAVEADADRARTLYVIRNSKIAPDWSEVERRTLSIAGRAVVSLIQTQGIGDLYRIYAVSQRDRVDFKLAYIPDSFNAPHREEFNTAYMRALFDVGYSQALKGYPWAKAPPGM